MSKLMLPVNGGRLWQRLMQLAGIGRYGTTGVNRQALTLGDLEAKQWLIAWAKMRALEAYVDAIGNVFVRRPGRYADAPAVAVGSHLDTEPAGGRFDGAYGVVAAMELINSLIEQGVDTECPVDLVAWSNEEGCRFHPGCMGSRAYVDPASLPAMLSARDLDGVSVEAALRLHDEALADLPRRPLGAPFKAFLEAHIEQGPVLEREGKAVAAVNAIQGRRVYEIVVAGRTDHAGTTPYAARCDALEYGTSLLQQLYARAAAEPAIRITPGRIIVEPNSPSVVPGRVHLTVDIRHPDQRTLQDVPAWLSSLTPPQAGSPAVEITEIDRMDPATFDAGLVEAGCVASAAIGGIRYIDGFRRFAQTRHALADFCPTAMIFVRCRGGVSHHEDEYASCEDLAAGARALSACLLHACGITSLSQSM